MSLRLPRKLWGVGALALLAAVFAVVPGRAGAQTAGSLSATLAGGDTISVTLTGVAAGNSYNIFACTMQVSTPMPPTCTIGNAPITAGSTGQASGTVSVAVSDLAVVEVFAQNVDNHAELYSVTVNGGGGGAVAYVTPVYTTTTTATSTPSCSAGSTLTYVNGVPTCTPTTATCAAGTVLVYSNGLPTCAATGTTGLVCTGYSNINGALVCTSYGGATTGLTCASYTFVNGLPVCTSNGLGFTGIPGCISYTFVNGMPVCLQY